jgi:hypothetical protein
LTGLWALLASLALPAFAAAAPPPPIDLHVGDGSEAWHPRRDFALRWTVPAASPEVAAVRYRVESPTGALVREGRIDWAAQSVEVRVWSSPGIYTAEVWLEDEEGAQGPSDLTQLRYDDARPGPAQPVAEPGWLSRSAFPFMLRIERPGEPLPLSGIRGYAISIDRNPLGAPCADALLCTDAETDLHGGVGADSLEVPALADGESWAHVMAVSGSGVHSEAARHTLLRVDNRDPISEIAGVPSGWTNHSVTISAHARDAESGMLEGTGAFTALRVDDGAPVLSPGATAQTTVIAEGAHSIAYYARDAAGNVNDGATANGIRNHPPGFATVRIDRTPPRVAFYSSLDPEDPERIRADVEDALAGGSDAVGSIGFRRAGSGDPFEALPTRVSPDLLVAEWDSDAYPPGPYEFRATAGDAAGNVAGSTRRRDGGEMILANPIKRPSVLEADLGPGRGGRTRVARFGRSIRLSGRLTTGSRRPIAGAQVEVGEGYAGGKRRRTSAVTKEDGSFSLRLPPGPSREVLVSFPGDRAYSGSLTRPLRLLVRSRLRLRVSAPVAAVGGPPVVFRGVVETRRGELPRGGKSVELQFRTAGLPWQEFRTVNTDRRGRFRYAYRFSDDDSRGVRFRFRAYAGPQDGWPYEPAASRPVAVRGK